jgi:Holliday junction resolvase
MNESKQQGTIGELKVAEKLIEKGFYVFKEIGDNAPIDLIAMKDNKLITFQVKSHYSKNNAVTISLHRSTTQYKVKYNENDFDIFAVYVPDKDVILYIPLEEVYKNESTMKFRFENAKNNQTKNIKFAKDYLQMKD